jgi:DNA-directed RNA polymerase subunit M/transcription elongation factor TFIIS
MSLRKVDNPDTFRVNIRNKLCTILDDEKSSINLEKGIFNYALKEAEFKKTIRKWDNKQFVQIYLDRLRSITINLKGAVLEHIKDGTLKAQEVAFMNHQELSPEKWKTLIDAKSKRDVNKFEVNMASATDTFTCRKCKSNQCTYYLQQTRSSDEATTIFVQCLPCGNRWKTS